MYRLKVLLVSHTTRGCELTNMGVVIPYSETFSHVKITSTQVIARLKARKKLSLMILLADFRGSEKRVAHALKNKKRNALVPLFYGFTRFLPYTVLTELIMLLSIPVANFQVRYTRSPKHKN